MKSYSLNAILFLRWKIFKDLLHLIGLLLFNCFTCFFFFGEIPLRNMKLYESFQIY